MRLWRTNIVIFVTLVMMPQVSWLGGVMEPLSDLDMSFFAELPDMPWGDDPFLKKSGVYFGKEESADAKLTLDVIYSVEGTPVAVINGIKYRVGYRLGKKEVVRIEKNAVLLKEGASLTELVMPPSEDEDSVIEIRAIDY